MEKWYQAIEKRCSIRKFRAEPTADDMESLAQAADSLAAYGIRIVISRSDKIFASRLGTPKIRGTECFAAFVSKEGRSPYLGYIGELFILECVARGLGTCWLGASFRMGAAQRAVEMEQGEAIICVTPLGYAAEDFKLRPRRSISSLTGLSVQDFVALPRWQQCAIEAARRAPSAVNAQPWAFEAGDDYIAVINTTPNLGYGKLDCGIAMIHMELGAAHCGVAGDWTEEQNCFVFRPRG